MNVFVMNDQKLPIVDNVRPDGVVWTIKEKLWLGLSKQEYKTQVLRNPVNWVLIVIFAIGLPL